MNLAPLIKALAPGEMTVKHRNFSLHPRKSVTCGEGGVVTTSDAELAADVDVYRNHGASVSEEIRHRGPRPYEMPEFKVFGFNYRMTALQAAVGLAQTERFNELVDARRRNAYSYLAALRGIDGIILPAEDKHERNVFWMFGLLVDDAFGCSRDELRAALAARGIETRTFFIPIHLQPIYFEQYRGQRYTVGKELCSRGMYLPSGSGLVPEEIEFVAQNIREVQKKCQVR